MSKVARKTSPEAGFSGRHNALVFCTLRSVGQQIVQQLERKNMRVWLVNDEQKLLSKLNEADPDLIVLEINATVTKPIEQIVPDIFIWMRGRAREINKVLNTPSKYLWERAKIVLFKSDVEMTPTGSRSADMADTDDVVRQCNLSGDVKYIGIYSSFSFIGKVRMVLEEE